MTNQSEIILSRNFNVKEKNGTKENHLVRKDFQGLKHGYYARGKNY